MGIRRTLTRELVCDGCGKYESETVIRDNDGFDEECDRFESEAFVYCGIGLMCRQGPNSQRPRRSCMIAAYKNKGVDPTECNLEGCDNEQIGTNEHDAPIFKCKRCGKEWTSINLKAANAALKKLYAPMDSVLDALPGLFRGVMKDD